MSRWLLGIGVMGLAACTTPHVPVSPVGGAVQRGPIAMQPAHPSRTSGRVQMERHDGHTQARDETTVADDGPSDREIDNVVRAFRGKYAAAGAPRVAVWFNRELSDDIHEWQRPLPARARSAARDAGDPAHAVPRAKQQPKRAMPPEDWRWRFEEGFMSVLLSEGTQLVDRPTMMRLAAAEEGTQSPNAPLGNKLIEMKALRGLADLYMELLVKRSQEAPYGYAFHVKLIEVETGLIKMSATTLGKPAGKRVVSRRYVAATDRGLEFQTDVSTFWPTLREVGARLAIEMMRHWSRTL